MSTGATVIIGCAVVTGAARSAAVDDIVVTAARVTAYRGSEWRSALRC